MTEWTKNFMKDLQEKRTTYADMIDFCCNNLILNNYIEPELSAKGFYFDDYCGSRYDEESDEYIDIYQQYIITSQDAERLAEYTNEIVVYNDELDLYLLCVTHFGTMWSGVPSNWKSLEELEEEIED